MSQHVTQKKYSATLTLKQRSSNIACVDIGRAVDCRRAAQRSRRDRVHDRGAALACRASRRIARYDDLLASIDLS